MKTTRIALLTAIALAAAAFGCATEPAPLDRTQPEALNKAMFTGEWYYKATTTDTDFDNNFTFQGEETASYMGGAFKVRWEITEKILNAYMIPQRYLKQDGTVVENKIAQKSPVLSFPITKHYDIRFRYNPTTREDLNVIEENYDRPWDQREYMEVDWSQNTVPNMANPMELDLATGEIQKNPVSSYENVEFFTHSKLEDGSLDADPAHDVKIETRKWDPKKDPEVYAINIDLKEAISSVLKSWIDYYYGEYMAPVVVKTRHSLMKAKPIAEQSYLPFHYSWKDGKKVCECADDFCKNTPNYNHCTYDDYFFRRYGFFRTEFEVYDPERVKLENEKQYMINRWDVTGGKKVTWYASPSFQEQINEGDVELKLYAMATIYSWNQALRDAMGMSAKPNVTDDDWKKPAGEIEKLLTPASDDPLQWRENEPLLDADGKQVVTADGTLRWKYELGDLRYPMINFTYKPQNAAPLGYGPSTPDSDTGELVQATLNAYGDWVDYVVRRTIDQFDVASGRCTIDQVKDGNFWNPATCKCDLQQFQGVYKGGILTGIPDDSHCFPQTSALTLEGGSREKGQWNRIYTMTPALMTSYMAKADISAPKKNLPFVKAPDRERRIRELKEIESQRRTQLNMSGVSQIKGTEYEARMVPHSTFQSLLPYAQKADDEGVIELLSPANRLSPAFLDRMEHNAEEHNTCRLEAVAFEPAIHEFVKQAAQEKWSRETVYRTLRRWIWYTTALHEMGHNLGLRHNFRGSADRRNFSIEFETYYKSFWDQINTLRAKYQPLIDAGDPEAYMAYVNEVDSLASPHNRYGSSSIMDYMGDWVKWQYPVGSYDRAAIIFGYGDKLDVLENVDKIDVDPPMTAKYGQAGWTLSKYKPGDFDQADADGSRLIDYYSLDKKTKSGRFVRYHMFCSDEKVFDDAFCTRFDIGTTATEIVRNMIRDSQADYFMRNFKRHNNMFDERRAGYYIRKWLWTYYTYAKSLAQLQLNAMWYDEAWSATFDGLAAVNNGPEVMDMLPGYFRSGSEDLLRASLLYYYYMLFDVLMRPEFGYAVLAYNNDLQPWFEPTDLQYIGSNDIAVEIPAGPGWGWADRWDVQEDIYKYYAQRSRIGVETDKVIQLEILSIPAALNDPLYYEKANGLNFWNSLWNGQGVQAWQVIGGMITDTFTHRQAPWCVRCDKQCMTNPMFNPPKLVAYPKDLLEGMKMVGDFQLFTGYTPCTATSECQSKEICGADHICKPDPNALTCGKDEYPLGPGMDALYAIYPIYYGIQGASHPWYRNNFEDKMDSMVLGGNHRFDVPAGKTYADFVNSSGTKTYRAVQNDDGLGISYKLVKQGERMKAQTDVTDFCKAADWTGLIPPAMLAKLPKVDPARTCDEVYGCYFYQQKPADFCGPEGWDSGLIIDYVRTRGIDRVEAMLIMMQDMIDIAGHQQWRVPGYLEEP